MNNYTLKAVVKRLSIWTKFLDREVPEHRGNIVKQVKKLGGYEAAKKLQKEKGGV